MYKKKSPAKKPLVGKQKNLPDHLKKKILASPAKMNRYDKDMMHERELIYDAKGQLHKADKAYKKGDKKKKQEMIHDRELIYDAKTDIHKEDMAKKKSMAKMYGKKSHAKQKDMNLRQAKKAVRKGMTPDEAGVRGLGYGQDYDKLLKSRAYKKQRADEAGYKSVRKAKKAAKANDGFLPDSPAQMSAELKYMPIVDREKSTMSAMGAHKVLKHMKGRM